MNGFQGDIKFTSGFEIQKYSNGEPYTVPAAHRGVSLIIGVDLSIFSYNLVISAYGSAINGPQAHSIMACSGMKGEVAALFLRHDRHLKTIRIPRDLAIECFPIFAERTWERTKRRWPNIASSPSEVQTAVFDIAYSRGVNNSHLSCMTDFIQSSDWIGLSKCIRSMQQRSESDYIRKRRREAAKLIS